MLVALIVLSSLATLGTLTVISIQSSLKASTNDRSSTIAQYAAESGAAMAIEHLRQVFQPTDGWTGVLDPVNSLKLIPLTGILANNKPPGDPDNPFSIDQNAWFEIEVRNNRNDPHAGLAVPVKDFDGQVVIHVTGHGPQNSVAIVEWEIQRFSPPPGPPTVAPWPVIPSAKPVVIVSSASVF